MRVIGTYETSDDVTSVDTVGNKWQIKEQVAERSGLQKWKENATLSRQS